MGVFSSIVASATSQCLFAAKWVQSLTLSRVVLVLCMLLFPQLHMGINGIYTHIYWLGDVCVFQSSDFHHCEWHILFSSPVLSDIKACLPRLCWGDTLSLNVGKAVKYKGWSRHIMTSAWFCLYRAWELGLYQCIGVIRLLETIIFPGLIFLLFFFFKNKWKGSFIAIKLQKSWRFYACAA